MNHPSIADRLPESQIGVAELTHFEINGPNLFAMRDRIPGGKYCRLRVNGRLYMSDTPFEWSTNWRIRCKANGRVLIAGLGIGLVLSDVLARAEVSHVTVIEKYQDVIDLIAPYYHNDKLVILCADIMEWKPPKGEMWDTIYFDIWPDLSTDDLKQMAFLHRRFAKRLNRANPNAWMDSWQREHLIARRRREQRGGYWR